MTKRAILYARVSGDDRGNEGRNLAEQLKMCRKYARQKGYSIIDEFSEDDRGASGASFELPQLIKAQDLATAGAYDVLVTREIDRFARSLAKQLIVEENLKRNGVRIEYVIGNYAETPEGQLMKNIKATIAEYERLKIRERVIRGRRLHAKAGSTLVYGNPPYGYSVTKRDKR